MQKKILAMRTMVMVSLISLSACASLPIATSPAASTMVLPEQWVNSLQVEEVASFSFWEQFESPTLLHLLQRAAQQNLDLAQQQARLEQARAWNKTQQSYLWPQADVHVEAGRHYHQASSEVASDYYGLQLQINYEADLWGGSRAIAQAALARSQQVQFETQAMAITVAAESASLAIITSSAQQIAALERENLALMKQISRYMAVRYREGIETALDVAQQQTWLAKQESRASQAQHNYQVNKAELAFLLGQADPIDLSGLSIDTLSVPQFVVGAPADLLLQRPDIAAAEAALSAAQADVHVARAALWPQLSLGVGVGLTGEHIEQLLRHPLSSLVAGLVAPIFNAGRLKAQHEQAQAYQTELLASYQQTVLSAFKEVQQALDTVFAAEQQYEALTQGMISAQQALRLVQLQHEEGNESWLSVLQTQQQWFDMQTESIRSNALHLLAVIQLYRAIGGGWGKPEEFRG